MASVKDLLVRGSSRFINKVYASEQIVSTVSQGTAPFVVDSSTVVTNLNADMVDGCHASTWYTKTEADNRYVNVTGDTMTGALTFSYKNDVGLIRNTYGSTVYNLIRNHNNGNISISASSGGLYYGYENTTGQYFYISDSEKMRLDSTGLGIGTTPSYKLHVAGTIYFDYGNTLKNNSISSTDTFNIRANSNGQYVRINSDGLGVVDVDWTNTLYLTNKKTYGEIYHNTGLPLYINTGNVGIGTAAPSYKLDISGTARATNNLLAGGIIGCTQDSGDHSYGISFYRAPNYLTSWGITCGNTNIGGTYGDVTDDWAMYFHNAGASTRGFIFTNGLGNNVASISARGYVTATKLFMPVGDKKLSSVSPIGHVKGDIHLYTNNYGSGTALTDGNVASITFGTGTGTNCQAGIYCVTSGSYGTKFIIGTTDSYATGVRYNTIIDHQGYITSSGFCKSGSSNSYLLLGGGSHLHLDRVVEVKRREWTDAISNCNSMSTTGIYSYSSATNRPSGTTWGSWLNIRLYDSDNNYHRQLFFDCYSSDKIWTRSCDNGTWTSWKEIISSANIGSQSVAYAASAGSLATTYYWANVAISTSQNNETTPIVNTIRTNIVGLRGNSGDGSYGISLYNGTGYHKQYGIWMGLTSVGGTFGYVTGDWAGYYTMDGATNRGWIWRHGNSTNVASISGAGNLWCGLATFKCGYFYNSNPSLGSLDSGTICIRASTSNGTICSYGLYIWDDYYSGCASLQSGYQNSASSNALPLSLQPLGGNVGIGTQSPGSKLEVAGSIYYSYGSYLRNTTVSSEAFILRGNNSGQYIRLSDGNSGFGIVDADWTNTFYIKNMKTYAELYHNTGQPLYINNCNVGIGVSSPSTKLHVRGTDKVSMSMDSNNEYRFSPSFKGGLHIDHASHGSGSGLNDGYIDGITFGVSSSAYAGIFVQNSGSYGSRIIFTTTNDYTYNKARMILTATGSLGIGTMSPSYKLHVIGDIYANGGWLRTSGSAGWYNDSYGGGIYMEDTTYVRVYNNKRFYNNNGESWSIYTAGGFATSRNSGAWLTGYYNSTWYEDTIYSHGNGNISINPPGGSLFLAYNRGYTYFGGGSYYIDRGGYFNGRAEYVTVSSGNDSNSTYYLVWHSGNHLYSTGGIYCQPYTDCIYATGSMYAAHFYENSDINLKTKFEKLDVSINSIASLPVFNFSWKSNLTSRNTGTSAQAVQAVFPNIVTESGEDHHLTLDYGVFGTVSSILVAKEVVRQEDKIKKLQNRIKFLEEKLGITNKEEIDF